jgi:hypothetical protein
VTGPADIPDDALADLLDDGVVNRSNRPGAVGSVPTTPSRTPAIADGSGDLPATMTPTEVLELKRLAGVEVTPGGVLDAVTGAKIRTVLRAVALSLTSFLGIADIVPGRIVGLILAGLTAAELGLYTLVKGAQQ